MIILKYSKNSEVLEIFARQETGKFEECSDCEGTGIIHPVDEDENITGSDWCFMCDGDGEFPELEEVLIGTCFSNATEHGRVLEYVLNAAKIPYTVAGVHIS